MTKEEKLAEMMKLVIGEPLIDVNPQGDKQQVTEEAKFESKSVMKKISHLVNEMTDILGNHQECIKFLEKIVNGQISPQFKSMKADICKMADEIDKLKQADINLKYLIGKNGKIEVN